MQWWQNARRWLADRGKHPVGWPAPPLDWDDWQLPDGRRAPYDVQRQIREADPRALLVYAGEAKWILGTLSGNRKTRAAAQQQFVVESANEVSQLRSEELHLLRLKVRGFVSHWMYEQNDPDARIVRHFRAMLWVEQNAVREVEQKALKATEINAFTLPERQRIIVDAAEGQAHDIIRYTPRQDGSQLRRNFDMGRRVG